jgi:hypothetical protein
MDAILDRPALDADQKPHLRTILRALFPDEIDGDSLAQAERGYRVCHPDYFDRYFEHSVDDRATSAASILAMLDLIPNRQMFAARLREVIASDELGPVLKKLQLHFEEIPVSAAPGFVGAFFDIGEELPRAKADWFTRESVHEAARMIFFLLKKLPDSASRARLVQQCLETSPGVVVPVSLVAALLSRRDKESSQPPLLDEAGLAPLRQEALARIKALAGSGRLWPSRHFALLLFRWRDWESQEAVNRWLQEALDTAPRKLEFLTQMVSESIVNGHRVEPFLDAKTLESFVNLEDLENAIAPLPPSTQLWAEAARKLLARALKFKAAGQDYGEVRERGDFDPEPEA